MVSNNAVLVDRILILMLEWIRTTEVRLCNAYDIRELALLILAPPSPHSVSGSPIRMQPRTATKVTSLQRSKCDATLAAHSKRYSRLRVCAAIRVTRVVDFSELVSIRTGIHMVESRV